MLTFELSSYHEDPDKFLNVQSVKLCGKVDDDFEKFCNESGRNDKIFDLENTEQTEKIRNMSTDDDVECSKDYLTTATDIKGIEIGDLSKKISSRFSTISELQG